MASNTIALIVAIKPGLSWLDALKLRLAGGKAAAGFWDAMARRIGRENDPSPPEPEPEPESVEMCIVGIKRQFPDRPTFIDLVPACMQLRSTDESKYSALRFEIGQAVKVTISRT